MTPYSLTELERLEKEAKKAADSIRTCNAPRDIRRDLFRDDLLTVQRYIRVLEESAPAMIADLRRMRKALEKIACRNDISGNKILEETGSYMGFDEPGSVEDAREALGDA